MDFKKDYYSILGVSHGSSKEELKAAYRRLAKKYHPDRGGTNDPRIMQEVNEAYGVLNDAEKRSIYDSFQQNAGKLKTETAAGTSSANSRMRTYERKFVVTQIEKVYLRGRITVKFWAESLVTEAMQSASVDYKVNPVQTIITIYEQHVDARVPSIEFENALHQTELFRSPLSQPVRCELRTNDGIILYDLQLNDIRIANAELTDITKYDNQSLGTLVGDVVAEVVWPKTTEHSEWVTECSGPTGQVEQKQEDGWNWQRSEYYHTDCTTYWSLWEKRSPLAKPRSKSMEPDPATSKNRPPSYWNRWKARNSTYRHFRQNLYKPVRTKISDKGVGILSLLVLLLLIILAVPQLLLPILSYFLLVLLLSVGARIFIWIRRLLPVVLSLLLTATIGVAIYHAVRDTPPINFTRPRPQYDTLITKRGPVIKGGRYRSPREVTDSLITHTIRWADYEATRYEVNLSVHLSALRASMDNHRELASENPTSIAAVYNELDQHDAPAMELLYNAFDSIRQSAKLDELQFANMLVSCVQSIPYYLIVDKQCSASLFSDEFTRTYLDNCNEDCCLGNVPYGVRAPLEFLGDLKGDCDTRALFLYTIFRHFNYNVALIISEYYKHAAIAIGFTKDLDNVRAVMRREDKNLYPWETTGKNFKPGILPASVGDLNYWRIAIINE